MKIRLYEGDCLEIMPKFPAGKVDMILADLPYGTTACKWDSIISLDKLWLQFKRLIKPNGAIVLFGSQPFTSKLAVSNLDWFRYEIIWDKVNKYTNALNSNKMPMKRHENILIFYAHLPTFNKQYRDGKPYKTTQTKGHGEHTQHGNTGEKHTTVNDGRHNPCSIVAITGDNKKELGLHPTQKPVELLEYLIKTYTNEGDLVFDPTMGSGSTGAACVNTNRNFVGIEKDHTYFVGAKDRIEHTSHQDSLQIVK